MPTPILILGTRSLAVEVMDLLSEIPGYEPAGFIENMNRDLANTTLEGLPIHWIDDLPKFTATHRGICALSTTTRKLFTDQAASLGLQFATLVHPSARVSKRAALGPGTFVSAMATISTHTTLGQHVFVNRGALIGHHTTIGDFCTIQPGANVAGAITLGSHTYVGMGACILDKLTIGPGSLIAAGAVVTTHLPEKVLAMGLPAKIIKTNIDPK